jgi:hypothetical protein
MHTSDLGAVRDRPGPISPKLASVCGVRVPDLQGLRVERVPAVLRSAAPARSPARPTLPRTTASCMAVVASVLDQPALLTGQERLAPLARGADGSSESLDTQGLRQWLGSRR